MCVDMCVDMCTSMCIDMLPRAALYCESYRSRAGRPVRRGHVIGYDTRHSPSHYGFCPSARSTLPDTMFDASVVPWAGSLAPRQHLNYRHPEVGSTCVQAAAAAAVPAAPAVPAATATTAAATPPSAPPPDNTDMIHQVPANILPLLLIVPSGSIHSIIKSRHRTAPAGAQTLGSLLCACPAMLPYNAPRIMGRPRNQFKPRPFVTAAAHKSPDPPHQAVIPDPPRRLNDVEYSVVCKWHSEEHYKPAIINQPF